MNNKFGIAIGIIAALLCIAALCACEGPAGSMGPAGPDGIQGEKGSKGDKGDSGSDGLDGIKGDTGEAGSQGEAGADGKDGVSIIWLGVFDDENAMQQSAGNARLNWAYYNSSLGSSFIYDGDKWCVLAKDGEGGPQGAKGPDTDTAHTVTLFAAPTGGNYHGLSLSVVLISTNGARIYYTTDNSDPSVSSAMYYRPIHINTTTTLKALAIKDGEPDETLSQIYYISEPDITISLAQGIYKTEQTLTLCSSSAEAEIYYTDDNTDPVTSATRREYRGEEIALTRTMTINAAAFKNELYSPVLSRTFTLQTPEPDISPAEGTLITGSTVTLSADNAEIWYTNDGITVPTPGSAESVLYSAPIKIVKPMTIMTIAAREGWEPSDIVTAVYDTKEYDVRKDISYTTASGGISSGNWTNIGMDAQNECWELDFFTGDMSELRITSLKMRGTGTGPKNFIVKFAYGEDDFNEIEDSAIIINSTSTVKDVLAPRSSIKIPSGINGKLRIRICQFDTINLNGLTVSTSTGNNAINNITITGVPSDTDDDEELPIVSWDFTSSGHLSGYNNNGAISPTAYSSIIPENEAAKLRRCRILTL